MKISSQFFINIISPLPSTLNLLILLSIPDWLLYTRWQPCTGITIVMIDSITYSFCLRHYVRNSLSYSVKETQPTLCKPMPSSQLSFRSWDQINISCYTEYWAFGPSLIYDITTDYINCLIKSWAEYQTQEMAWLSLGLTKLLLDLNCRMLVTSKHLLKNIPVKK